MRITPQNIDKWLFDYFEGNLSEDQVQELELYCLLNPEADAEKEAWEQAYLKDQKQPVFDNKEALMQPVFWTDERKWVASILLLLLPTLSLFVFLPMGRGHLLAESATIPSKNVGYVSEYKAVNNLLELTTARVFNNYGDASHLSAAQNNANNGNQLVASGLNHGNAYSSSNEVHNRLSQRDQVSARVEEYQAKQNKSFADNSNAIINSEMSEPIALYQELDKYGDDGANHVAKISDNPDYDEKSLDLSQSLKEFDIKKKSFSVAVRRFFRRLFSHQVALSNLRDPSLVLPDFQLMNYNSSFAGSIWSSRMDMRYRTRWIGKDQFMHKATFSYDSYLPGLKGGLGIVANFKDLGNGAYRDYNVSVIYSPKLQVAKEIFIEPSIKLTMGAHTANHSKTTGLTDVEWDRGFVMNTLGQEKLGSDKFGFYQDIGAGVVINTKWFYAGAMFDNLAQHRMEMFSGNDEVIRMPKRYSAVIATDYQSEQNERFILSPFIAYENFGKINEMWAGTHLRWNGLLVGASMSTDLNFKGLLGFQVKGFKMSYSYDHTYSYVHNKKLGSHSLLMRVNMNQFNRSTRRRY